MVFYTNLTIEFFYTGLIRRSTAILYWTYPDELTNDPSLRVNQK